MTMDDYFVIQEESEENHATLYKPTIYESVPVFPDAEWNKRDVCR